MGDPDLFDLLHERIREDGRIIDEYGRETRGAITDPILELENISTLFITVALIAENAAAKSRSGTTAAWSGGAKTADCRSFR